MSELCHKKVAFVGTSCIGKTTLLSHYRKIYSDNSEVAFVEEAARLFFSSHHVSEPFSEENQGHVQQLALGMEREIQESGARLIFCDRSVIDAPAYVRATGDIEGSKRLLERVNFWLPTYAAIILLDPKDVPYERDEIRKESPEQRERFHQGFLDIFSETELAYHLIGGTLDYRIQQIDNLVVL